MHKENCAVTLTYDDKNVTSQLVYADFQEFMKALRYALSRKVKYLNPRYGEKGARKYLTKRIYKPLRFFMCGEYGDNTGRAHFHALIFGHGFYEDRKPFKKSNSGIQLYESAKLLSLWNKGHALVQDATYEMAAYIARYVTKKIGKSPGDFDENTQFDIRTGDILQGVPEFGRMSLKPAIGLSWFNKYRSDITNTNTMVVAGREVKVPSYYKKLIKGGDFIEYRDFARAQVAKGKRYAHNNTVEKLLVREEIAEERFKQKKREFL